MTTYGTIPTESPDIDFLSRARDQIRSGLAIRKPWLEMFQFDSFSFPLSAEDTVKRIKTNAFYFRVNYTMIVLFMLFISLLWHPISLIVFIITMVAWLYLFFLRDEQLVVLGYLVDDRVVMIGLSMLTIGMLLLTNVTSSIVTGLSIGVMVVLVHGGTRNSEDLFLGEDEEERIRSKPRVSAYTSLRSPISSSFTSN